MSLSINLCSGPRNVSTALMYSFAQRPDTHVIDEPLYAHYLKVTGAQHPGRREVLASMNHDGQQVIQESFLGHFKHPVVFIKNMGHHLIDLDWKFLHRMTTVLLIRDPEQMLPSLVNQIPRPTLADTALAMQRKVFDYLREIGQSPCILDAREVLADPEGVLRQLCTQIGVTFDHAMLQWKAGPIPEDGIWAPYWYHVIHQSTGFAPYRPKSAPFPERLKSLLAECLPHYNYLYQYAIKA